MKFFPKLALSLVMVSALAACGGSDSPPAPAAVVTSQNVTAPANPTVIAAVVAKAFTFGAVPALATSAPTALMFADGGATPGFAISSPEGSATGTTRFGSCIFTIAPGSTYPASHPLASGKTVTINPCELVLNTAGATANGASNQTQASFKLGNLVSQGIPLPVTVSADGTVAVGAVVLGIKAVVGTITGS